MQILTAGSSGFCSGVKLAMKLALQTAAAEGHIYSLGPLIHNPQEIASLADRIIPVDSLEQITERPATVMIRSHGVPPQTIKQANELGLRVIDGTCCYVKKAQDKAAEFVAEGFKLYILGDAQHPEVIGLQGHSGGQAVILFSPQDAENEPQADKIALIAQTTQKQDDFKKIERILKEKAGQFIAANTICNYTRRNHQATREVAAQVDAMFVIGGHNSSNTKKLAQISKEANIDVYHIESLADLDLDIVRGYGKVGITAGASTPEHIIEEVVRSMREVKKVEGADIGANESDLNENNNIEPEALEQSDAPEEEAEYQPLVEDAACSGADEAAEDAPEEEAEYQPLVEDAACSGADEAAEDAPGTSEEAAPAETEPVAETVAEAEAAELAEEAATAADKPADSFAQTYGDMKEIRRGARVKGTVVQVKDEELLVDIGGKSEGVLSASELNADDAKNIHERFHVGDEIDVLILRKENQEGYPILSKRRVDQDQAWDRLDQLKQDKTVISGIVTDVVKGGLLVDVGLRGFVPASLVSLGYVEDLATYIGHELDMKIIECDKSSNKLVLSAKAVLRKASAALKEKTLSEIAEGQTRKGVVRRITNFGAFVDIGGVDGLLHVSEMAWYRVNHPADLLKEGDEIEVYVLGVDAENEKISLGLKQLNPSPWSLAAEKYPEGSVITAKVMRTTTFGAFLEIEPGVEGLVHISQLAHHRVEKTEDVLKPGDMAEVKVLAVDPVAKRMSLSIKATLPPEEPQAETTETVATEAAAAETTETPAEASDTEAPTAETPAVEAEALVEADAPPAGETAPAAEAAAEESK
jgi:(E)-4-hydroxy-3-methyl-but-2-enyl pyrophosphate reductase